MTSENQLLFKYYCPSRGWAGESYKTIFKEFKVHHSTVREIIHRWKTLKTIDSLPGSGHPSKFTPK